MQRIKKPELRSLFDNGVVSGFVATRAEMVPGWKLCILLRSGHQGIYTTAQGEDRIFTKLDTLVSEAESFGMKVTGFKLS